MSTKCTVVYDDNFHLYSECFEQGLDRKVWLQLEGKDFEFEVNQHGVTVGIPLAIWEVIRKRTIETYDLIGKSTAEIRKICEEFVANRSKEGLGALCGMMVYGDVDDDPQVQIDNGVAHYLKEQAEQELLIKTINDIENKQSKPMPFQKPSES